MRVQKEAIERDLLVLSEFNAEEEGKGITRLPFTQEEKEAEDALVAKFEEAGLEVYRDPVGNLFGRRQGKKPDAAPIVIGSHLDTVINGGMFDGAAGVIAGLEVVRALNSHEIETERPIEVANFMIEESTAFGKSCIGSRAAAGILNYDDLAKLTDKKGKTLQEYFQERGVTREDFQAAIKQPGDIHSYLELHIEQADNLIKAEKPVGIVSAIAAATRFKVKITGQASHSGATPMGERQDALCAAAEIVLGIEEIASDKAGNHTVGTVGDVKVKPGAVNVVPGEAELVVDLRDIDKESKEQAAEKIKALVDDVGRNRSVEVSYEVTASDDPIPATIEIFETAKASSKAVRIDHQVMHSAAAHDAAYIANIANMGMIFVRSYGGSHNPEEWADYQDIALATEVLLETVTRLAGGKLDA